MKHVSDWFKKVIAQLEESGRKTEDWHIFTNGDIVSKDNVETIKGAVTPFRP